jgi:hypothetical protein
LRVFTIANGIPAAAQGNPFTSGLVQAVHGVVHRAGFYMVADRAGPGGPLPDQVGVYRVSGSGADTTLLAVDGSPYPAGDLTNVLAFNGAERFLFASNGVSRNNITTFAVDSTSGQLSPGITQPANTLGDSGQIQGLAYVPGIAIRINIESTFGSPGNIVDVAVSLDTSGLTSSHKLRLDTAAEV